MTLATFPVPKEQQPQSGHVLHDTDPHIPAMISTPSPFNLLNVRLPLLLYRPIKSLFANIALPGFKWAMFYDNLCMAHAPPNHCYNHASSGRSPGRTSPRVDASVNKSMRH